MQMQNGSKSILEQQKQATYDAFLEGKISDADFARIARLSDYLAADEGEEAFVETMFAYATGKADWKKDYAEFFDELSPDDPAEPAAQP